MESSFRKTSNSVNKFKNFSDKLLPPIRTTRNTRLNMQRRDKLASTLTEKFILKFGSNNNNGNFIHNDEYDKIQKEITNHFQNEINLKKRGKSVEIIKKNHDKKEEQLHQLIQKINKKHEENYKRLQEFYKELDSKNRILKLTNIKFISVG